MSISAKVKQSTVVEELADGTYPALLYRMIHVGRLPETYKGATKLTDKILLSFVVPSHKRIINDREQAVTLHIEYTLSLFEGAHLRKAINNMSGKDMFGSLDDNSDFEVSSLIGTPCMVTTRLQDIGNNRQRPVIIMYAPLPDDELMPESPYPLAILDYSAFDWALFSSLSTYLKNKIQSTPEFQAIPEAERAKGIADAQRLTTKTTENLDDDLPF